MGLSFGLGNNLSLEEAEPVLLKAIELGCTFWDTAVSLLQKTLHYHQVQSELTRTGCLSSRCK